MEVAEPPTATEAPKALVCATSCQNPSELQSPSRMKEDMIDYEVEDKDLADGSDTELPPTPKVPLQDPNVLVQMHPSDPYDFD